MKSILPLVLPCRSRPRTSLQRAFSSGVHGFTVRYVGGKIPVAPCMFALGPGINRIAPFSLSDEASHAISDIAMEGLPFQGGNTEVERVAHDSVFSHTSFGKLLPGTITDWEMLILPTLTALVPQRDSADKRSLELLAACPPEGFGEMPEFQERIAPLSPDVLRMSTFQVFQVYDDSEETPSAHHRVKHRHAILKDVAMTSHYLKRRLEIDVLRPVCHPSTGVHSALFQNDNTFIG